MASNRRLEPSSFEGASLEQMRGWVNGGSGAQSLYDKEKQWRGEEKYMRDLAERTKAKLAHARAVTESRSGETMQNAMSPVVLWTEVAADNALAESQRMREQGEAFGRVQSSVPTKEEEVPVPEETTMGRMWAGLTGGKTDNEQALAHNEKLRQDGITAFNSYDGASQTTVAAAPVFTAPPPGGIDTGVRSGPHGNVGQVGSNLSTGTGSPASTRSTSWSGTLDSPTGSPSNTGYTGGRTPTSPQYAGNQSAWTRSPGQVSPGYQQRPPVRDAPGIVGTPGYGSNTPGRPGTGTGTGKGTAGGRTGGGPRVAGGGGRPVGSKVPVRGLSSLGTGGGVGSGGGARSLAPGAQSGTGRPASPSTTSASSASSSSSSARSGMMRGMPAGGQQQDSEDEEHETPSFLVGDYGYFDEDLPRVAPPVIGDDSQ